MDFREKNKHKKPHKVPLKMESNAHKLWEYQSRLPIVISVAKRLRIKATILKNEANYAASLVKEIEAACPEVPDEAYKTTLASAEKKALESEKAAAKAIAMAKSRTKIADELATILGKRTNWRDESERPDYTKRNWYENSNWREESETPVYTKRNW
jgi:hypothetical protein